MKNTLVSFTLLISFSLSAHSQTCADIWYDVQMSLDWSDEGSWNNWQLDSSFLNEVNAYSNWTDDIVVVRVKLKYTYYYYMVSERAWGLFEEYLDTDQCGEAWHAYIKGNGLNCSY